MKKETSKPVVREIMMEFAHLTGLLSSREKPRRYLWTDAFAVCNFLTLYQQTSDERYKYLALRLTLDELCTIYRIQFPVLRQNENDTWYDQNGRIVFTVSKGLPGVGFSRSEWNEIKDMKSENVSRTITDDTQPGGPREPTINYTAPFDRCNREADYAAAWAAFEKRGVKQE